MTPIERLQTLFEDDPNWVVDQHGDYLAIADGVERWWQRADSVTGDLMDKTERIRDEEPTGDEEEDFETVGHRAAFQHFCNETELIPESDVPTADIKEAKAEWGDSDCDCCTISPWASL